MKITRRPEMKDQLQLLRNVSSSDLESDDCESLFSAFNDVEKAYVFDAYTLICDKAEKSPLRSDLRDFIDQLEHGSCLIDIGCGDGRCLGLNKNVFSIGFDNCIEWFKHEISSTSSDALACDIISIPIRDGVADGLLCCEVLHHLSTVARRIKAVKEISRLLIVRISMSTDLYKIDFLLSRLMAER